MSRPLSHILLCLVLWGSFAPASAQSGEAGVSPTFPKVVFVDANARVLLVFDERRQAFEVPAQGFMQGPTGFRQYIDRLAGEIGLAYERYRLGGIFTYVAPQRPEAYLRPYLVVPVAGTAQAVADGYRWFPLDDAIAEIRYPASARILERIMRQPEHVWGATFEEHGYTDPVDVDRIVFRIVEDFHRID